MLQSLAVEIVLSAAGMRTTLREVGHADVACRRGRSPTVDVDVH